MPCVNYVSVSLLRKTALSRNAKAAARSRAHPIWSDHNLRGTILRSVRNRAMRASDVHLAKVSRINNHAMISAEVKAEAMKDNTSHSVSRAHLHSNGHRLPGITLHLPNVPYHSVLADPSVHLRGMVDSLETVAEHGKVF